MSDQEWEDTQANYRDRLKQTPNDGELWFEYARFLSRECDNPTLAVRAFEEAQRLLSGQDLRLQLGAAYIKAGQYDLGGKLIRQSVEDRPTAHGYCILADALINRGECDEAMELLRKSQVIDPSFEECYFLMGEAMRKTDRLGAIVQYQKATTLDPNYQYAWQRLGSVLISDPKMVEQGIRCLRKALELDPDDAWSYLYLGNALWSINNLEDAERAYLDAIELNAESKFFIQCYHEFMNNKDGGSGPPLVVA